MNPNSIDLNKFDAVIFDIDGTIVDNTPFHIKAWKEFFKLRGIILTDEEYSLKFSGKRNDSILQIMFPGITSWQIKEFGDEKEQLYRDMYSAFIKPVKGFREIIDLLIEKNKKLAIATTSNKANRDFVLSSLNLNDCFPIVVGDTDVKEGKPNPEIYLIASERLEVDPRRCLVFEDSPPGVIAGKSAGMIVVGVMTAHTKDELKKADFHIHNFSELMLGV